MAAGSTYTPIASTTLGSSAASIDFSNVSTAYTDIKAVVYVKGTSASHLYCRVGNNGLDNSALYSLTGNFARLANTGPSTETGSERNSGQSTFRINPFTYIPATTFATVTVDFMGYSNARVKVALSRASARGDQPYYGSESTVHLWRSSSQINTMSFYMLTGNLAAGTSITLYGISAA